MLDERLTLPGTSLPEHGSLASGTLRNSSCVAGIRPNLRSPPGAPCVTRAFPR